MLSTTVTLMLTTTHPAATAFQHHHQQQQQQLASLHTSSFSESSRMNTRRYFRDGAAGDVTTTTTEPFWTAPTSSSDSSNTDSTNRGSHQPLHVVNHAFPTRCWEPTRATQTPQVVTTNGAAPTTNALSLPLWLSESKDAMWESNWHTLEEAMLESYFTPQETQRLLQTIEIAAQGNRHQMSTAAEFCQLLVETMEMGLTALMAAAHHICACVTARHAVAQHKHLVWDQAFAAAVQTVGADHHSDHVTSIAKDAGRLKTLEMVAAMIYSDQAASRVTPDAQDAQNLRSLLLSETKDWRALAIRSAAALFRLRGILHHSSSYNGLPRTPEAMQCSREALYIYAPLASRLGMHRLKNELEGAAFRILYRRQSQRVHSLARELRPRHSKPHLNRGLVEMCDHSLDISSCMKHVLNTVQTEMTQLLREDAHFVEHVQDFSVTARVKEPYSLWKKMLRKGSRHVMEVPDAIALRIVLDARHISGEDISVRRARERALCYYAQELCLGRWQPAADSDAARFKDYIESPKRNGYQSLHYTAHTMWDDEDFQFEIQVRTGEMHQVAEFGLASHWDYKAQQKYHRNNNQHEDGSPEVTISPDAYSNDAYVRSVQEWHWQHHAGTAQDDQWMSESTGTLSSVEEEQLQQQHHSSVASSTVTEEEWLTSSDDETGNFDTTERTDRIRARTKNLQPYIEALTAARTDLAREHVFVFMTSEGESTADGSMDYQHGRVLSLPAGACVLDALREGERELGIPFPDLHRLNGELSTKVTSQLQNGDILTIPLRATPSTMA